MTLCQLLSAHIERSAQLLPCADRPGLTIGLNRRDKRARYLRLFRELLLGKLPVLTPHMERGLSLKSTFADLQRYELVLAILKTRFGSIVGLHVGKHFRIVHHLLQVLHRNHGEFLALAGNRLDLHQYIPPARSRF